ncbi:MAG: T9SS type A sorting domain-containing protein [Bacteroidota bacterium]
MKKNKLRIIVFVLLGFGLSNLQAQESINATGGDASGSGGSASYSVGQTVYTSHTGTNGNSIAQGVQQPYEISVVTGIIEAQGISLSVSAYPNPTTDYLTVKVGNYETAKLQYQVFDINGKLLQTVKATGNQTQIETSKLVPANYFVKVIDSAKEIKVFKIIKTQ